MNLEPENIFYGVLAFSWIEFFWGSYLSHRQRKIYKKHVEVPDEVKGLLDEETFTKARLYALDKSNFGAFQGIFSQVLSTVFMVYFAFKFLWDVSGEFCSQDLYSIKISCSVKLGDKELFDKEQIGVKEPCPVTNLLHKDQEHLA